MPDAARWLASALRVAGMILPPHRRVWVDAMIGELRAISDDAERIRFAVGALGAILRFAAGSWLTEPRAWLLAVAGGALIPLLDAHRGAICLLVPLCMAAGLLLGALAPVSAWRWAIGILAGMAAASTHAGLAGFLDRADALPVSLLLAVAVQAGAAARRLAMRPVARNATT
jgi:hypothetical protein